MNQLLLDVCDLHSLLSLAPAPPRGYIHLHSGMPSSLAKSVDVKMHPLARLTVLNAFMKSGSCKQLAFPQRTSKLTVTRKTNHPIHFGHPSNKVRRCYRLLAVPCILMPLGDFREFRIQLRRFIVVFLYRLFSMSSEAIFVQGIHVDWCSYAMYGPQICV